MVYIFNGLTCLYYEFMGEIFINPVIQVLNLLSAFRNHKELAIH